MSKKKNLKNKVENKDMAMEAPQTDVPQEKQYPVEALILLSGNVLEVKEILAVYTDAYRIVTAHDTVKLVFFHAIAFVENGNYGDAE